tara:strand:- start:630 stop:860 length:231 start_codon:yes stop_codon:yes gene_type:complete
MIPEIIEHGVNGFISNEESELKEFLATLLNDESLAQKMGEKARETVVEKFAEEKFIQEWDAILRAVSKVPYIGRFK